MADGGKAPPRVVVYTAITGGKDGLKEDQPDMDAAFHAFLDETVPSDRWRVHPAASLFRYPRRNARMHKVLSHKYFPNADFTVWIDGSISILKDIGPLLEGLMAKCDVATFRHPERECLYQEAEICKRYRLDVEAVIDGQVKTYRGLGVPENLGLFETNVLIRKNNARVRHFNQIWWCEICFHSLRDQISFPYAAWKAGLKVGIIPGNSQNLAHLHERRTGSEYFAWQAHLK